MKHAIILPDGAADEPLAQLGGRTPLEAANIPHIDWVAQRGRVGRVVTCPAGYVPGTDVATLTLLGYDPDTCYTGRAPIEAAARGLTAGPDELIFRCNFVTISDGRMQDFTAGHIAQEEAERLVSDLNELVRTGEPALADCTFHAGVSYRNLMIAGHAAGMEQLTCVPPHDIPNQPVRAYLPRGVGHERVRAITARAAELFADHPLNRARGARGRPAVTDIWLWGQGRPVELEPFAKRFGRTGAVITGVDLIRGLALSVGMTLIDVPGATGYLDTNYAGKGAAAVRALEDYELVVVHVEAADEAGHLGDADAKVEALERIDELVVGPVLDALRSGDRWRILVAPDHPTPCTTRAHSAEPPPFCFAGQAARSEVRPRSFSEAEAVASGLLVDPGYGLMPLFLAR